AASRHIATSRQINRLKKRTIGECVAPCRPPHRYHS
ncbi:hypothetical protein SeLEV6574_g04937, partial [Synchytrium endobioticum]